jgi:hypothetical protein
MRDEPLPDVPIYNPALQAVLGDTKTKLQQLSSSMERCGLFGDKTSDLFSHAQQTERLAGFEYPKTRVVGFVGDSGVGNVISQLELFQG